MPRRPLIALVPMTLLVAAVALTGCTTTVHLEPATYANDPRCADVSVRLPDTLTLPDGSSDITRVYTDAQATAAWGTPTAVIFACGLEPPGPTTQQCVTFNGVDWVIDDTDPQNLRLTTYGRTPAVQMYVDTTTMSADDVIGDRRISSSVARLPSTANCTTPDVAPTTSPAS